MKYLTFIILIALGCSSYSYASCVGPEINGGCVTGIESDSSSSGYESNSGTSYQYDLNNPVDRNSYSTDLDAQRRDQMNTNPNRNLDRQSGAYGGGVYDD